MINYSNPTKRAKLKYLHKADIERYQKRILGFVKRNSYVFTWITQKLTNRELRKSGRCIKSLYPDMLYIIKCVEKEWQYHYPLKGFDTERSWDLYEAIVWFLEPRLYLFINMEHADHPNCFSSQEEYNQVIKHILEGFKIIREIYSRQKIRTFNYQESAKADRAIQLFSYYWPLLEEQYMDKRANF